jgi:predicted O-methyltransferase YrrM
MNSILQDLINRSLYPDPRMDSDWHAMTIFSIGIQLKAKRILELGTRDGRTTLPLLLSASMTDGNLTSVDISNTPWECPIELQSKWNFIKSDAIKFLSKQEGIYDLIFIDDWHTYAHVKKELELIDRLITPSSIILIHDLMGMWNHPNYFQPDSANWNGGEWEGGGPYKAMLELDTKIWEWSTIPVNNGLTILRKKSNIIQH